MPDVGSPPRDPEVDSDVDFTDPPDDDEAAMDALSPSPAADDEHTPPLDEDNSDLSEIDEDQFDDYDPATADIIDRPVAIDANAAQTLKASRRKGSSNADTVRGTKKATTTTTAEEPTSKHRREKRPRPDGDQDADAADTEEPESGAPKKQRRRRVVPPPKDAATAAEDGSTDARPKKPAEPVVEDESLLTPEERRRRAISRALDAAGAMVKKSTQRRKKKDEIDLLEDQIDEELSDLKVRMEEACQADQVALQSNRPASQKLKILPEVAAMLSRQNAQDAVLDPEINFLQHVRFFLEPLENGTLPAYAIQRDLFSALTRLPVQKEALISSNLGGLVLFYTRSKQPEMDIKRMAERLVEEWSRPILNKTDDWSKRQIETRYFDPEAAKRASASSGPQVSLARRPASSLDAERERFLAPAATSRFRPTELPSTYTVAPKSTFQPGMPRTGDHRPIGAGGLEAFRRMTQKSRKR